MSAFDPEADAIPLRPPYLGRENSLVFRDRPHAAVREVVLTTVVGSRASLPPEGAMVEDLRDLGGLYRRHSTGVNSERRIVVELFRLRRAGIGIGIH